LGGAACAAKLDAMDDHADHPDVAVFPPALIGGSALLAFALHRFFPLPAMPRRVARPLGLALTLAAAAVAASGFRALHDANTTFDVRESTTAVVTNGVYAYTRNPLYVGLILLFLGLGTLRNSRWHWMLALPTAAALHYLVIVREEAYLERKFGAEYRDYKTRVRRWL
jgi:protein-S-isoprenylcysteine O-methyltransferase Ste14